MLTFVQWAARLSALGSFGLLAQDRVVSNFALKPHYATALWTVLIVSLLVLLITFEPVWNQIRPAPKLVVGPPKGISRDAEGGPDLQEFIVPVFNQRDSGGASATADRVVPKLEAFDQEGRLIASATGYWGHPDKKHATFRPTHEEEPLVLVGRFPGDEQAWLGGAEEPQLGRGDFTIRASLRGDGLRGASRFEWDLINGGAGGLLAIRPKKPPGLWGKARRLAHWRSKRVASLELPSGSTVRQPRALSAPSKPQPPPPLRHSVTFYTFGRQPRRISTKGRPTSLRFTHPFHDTVRVGDLPVPFPLSTEGWGEGPLLITAFSATGFEIDETEAPPVMRVEVEVSFEQAEPDYPARVVTDLIASGLSLKNSVGYASDLTLTPLAFEVESWVKECWTRLGESAPTKQALFTYDEHTPAERDELAAFLDSHIKELQRILEAIPGEALLADVQPARDLDVVIEDYEWDSFQYEAFILEIKVRIVNQTSRKKHVRGYALQVEGRDSPPTFPTIEARREVERRRAMYQRLDGQSTIDPAESIVGWLVYALPWSSDPGPTDYTLSVRDELNQDYVATVRGHN